MGKAKVIRELEKNKALSGYLFIRGFLVTDMDGLDLSGHPFYGNWHRQRLGGRLYVYSHHLTAVTLLEHEEAVFFMLGHAYNPFTMEHRESALLQRIAEAYGNEGFQEKLDELTGVFVFGVYAQGKLTFLVDPSGMQSACHGSINGYFFLSSHAQLAADLCGLEMAAFVKKLTAYKWYGRVMGPYLPADLTSFEPLKRVVPNISYTWDGTATAHRRFYPLKTLEIARDEEAYGKVIAEAAAILKNSMALVARKWERPAISLTGGIDSNTTFAAANGLYERFTAFTYVAAPKETIDAEAAEKIAKRFAVKHTLYSIPETADELPDYDAIAAIIAHNNAYAAIPSAHEMRKRVYLMRHLEADVEVKSWVSETIRAYWYKHYGRQSMPPLSAKLFRNLYKIFLLNRPLAHEVDKVFARYIADYEYAKVPVQYPPADLHFNEVTWGSWGGMNISEMKIYVDLTFIYNNRKFLDLLFRVPLDRRISDRHHLDMKKILNPELAEMGIRVVNMKETRLRSFLLNLVFSVNMALPF